MSFRSISLRHLLIAWIAITALLALNRGIDLLWGMALLIAAASVVAALLPKLQVRGVTIRRIEAPHVATVGQAAVLKYEVAVSGWARYGLEIFDRLNGESALQPVAFVASVRGSRQVSTTWTPQVRGHWQLRELAIESQFPLGLTCARRVAHCEPHEITVYPDFVPLRALPRLDYAHPRFEHTASARRGSHDEVFGLRPYAPGDERRAIHWRSSARRGDLVVKELEQQQGRELWLLLELADAAHAGIGPHSTCEDMIRIAHSLAVKAHDEGVPVGLLYRVADVIQQVPPAANRATYLQIRETLARVNSHAQLPLAKWAERFRDRLPKGGTWIVFNLGGANDRAALERLANQRHATTVFIESDKRSYAEQRPGAIQSQRSARSSVTTVAYGADLRELFRP